MNKDKLIRWLNNEIESLKKQEESIDLYKNRIRACAINNEIYAYSNTLRFIQSEPEETCTYCQGEESLSERELEQYSDVYTGFGVDISGGKLLIESCTAVGGPSKDYTFSDTKIEINYCPICGRKLNEKAGE